MQRKSCSLVFKKQALNKISQLGSHTLNSGVADELNSPLGPLKYWLTTGAKLASLSSDGTSNDWKPAQRLLGLHISHPLPADEPSHQQSDLLTKKLLDWKSPLSQNNALTRTNTYFDQIFVQRS